MKKLSPLFILFIALLIVACTKRWVEMGPNYNISISPATIDNLKNSTDTSFLSFVPLDTSKGIISFYISGLPSGITIDSSQATKGVPPFSTAIVFRNDGSAKSGTYNVKVNCYRAAIRNFRSYDLSLTVLPAPAGSNCASRSLGSWPRCYIDTGTSVYSDQATADPSNPNRVILANGNGMGYPMYADLDCATNTLSIAHSIRVTASGWHYFSGSGTFSAYRIHYSFQDSTSTAILRYNVTMSR